MKIGGNVDGDDSTRNRTERGFQVEQISTGPHANGFGVADDGRSFAFRVNRNKLYLEVYRADLHDAVPDKSDVEAVAEHSITEIDLTDERSVIGAVRDAVGSAEAVDRDSTVVRAFFGRVGSVLDGI